MRKIIVIGAGVSGLSTAYVLLKSGYHVEIISSKRQPSLTSNVAGALWEWPPAVCGFVPHNFQLNHEKEILWSIDTYKKFYSLYDQNVEGILIRKVNFYFHEHIESSSLEWQKICEMRNEVISFKHTPEIIQENNIAFSKYKDAYQYDTPIIDMDVYLAWLEKSLLEMGCVFHSNTLTDHLSELSEKLLAEHKAHAIINCTGLGSHDLGDGSSFPVRGGLLKVLNDGKKFPKIEQAHCTAIKDMTQEEFIFIVPRNKEVLLLGGFSHTNESNLNITPENEPIFSRIRERCINLFPQLENAIPYESEPFVVGLRPYRKDGVRLELDPECPNLIHNYGHGGQGVLLSWGCAFNVHQLVQSILS